MARPQLPPHFTFPHISNEMPAAYEQGGVPHTDWYNVPFNQGYGSHYATPGVPPPHTWTMPPQGYQTYAPPQSALAPPGLPQPDRLQPLVAANTGPPAGGPPAPLVGPSSLTAIDFASAPACPPLSVAELQMSDMFKFDLRIKEVRTTKANYQPSNAIASVNAIIQNEVAQWMDNDEIPTNLFSVIYSTPKPGSTEEGRFRCSVPVLLKELILHLMPSHTKKTVLSFAGDDEGTNYKLEYEEVAEYVFSRKDQDRDRSDKRWLLLHLDINTTLGQRLIFAKALEHFKNYGIHLVQNNEKAFTRVQTANKEQGTFSYNAWFTIKDTEVPTTKIHDDAVGLPLDVYNFEGMGTVILNEDTGETATAWMTPDNARQVLKACNLCFKPLLLTCHCIENREKEKKARLDRKRSAGNRQTAAEKNTAAKKRIQAKAAKSAEF